jgi:hypothetical protein
VDPNIIYFTDRWHMKGSLLTFLVKREGLICPTLKPRSTSFYLRCPYHARGDCLRSLIALLSL